jgi:hypothetical protein
VFQRTHDEAPEPSWFPPVWASWNLIAYYDAPKKMRIPSVDRVEDHAFAPARLPNQVEVEPIEQ